MIEVLQEKVLRWAENRDDIRAVLLIGSQARRDHPADALSDIDLVLLTTEVQAYHAAPDWLGKIGQVVVSVPNPRSDGYPEYLVLFEGDHKLDFNFFPVNMLEELSHGNAFGRGFHFLMDKDGLVAQIPPSSFSAPQYQKPSPEAFTTTVNEFWLNARVLAKTIRRGELWVAKNRDRALKDNLLQMVEWHTQAQQEWNIDTWYRGRFIAEWTSPEVYEALQQTFAHFDAIDSWRALMSSMALFRQLATEIARLLGYTYPQTTDEEITRYINRLYAEN